MEAPLGAGMNLERQGSKSAIIPHISGTLEVEIQNVLRKWIFQNLQKCFGQGNHFVNYNRGT